MTRFYSYEIMQPDERNTLGSFYYQLVNSALEGKEVDYDELVSKCKENIVEEAKVVVDSTGRTKTEKQCAYHLEEELKLLDEWMNEHFEAELLNNIS